MKEPFVNVADLISQTQTLSDLELQQYLQSLSGSEQTNFIATNVNDALQSVKSVKQQRFTDLISQIRGSDNNITSTAYYLARTKDLTDMSNDIDAIAIKQLNVSDVNGGLADRQNEINEWANFNKLDTLFFMQVLFITLTFIAFMIFLRSNNLISQNIFGLTTFFAGIIAIFTLVTRARYTSVMRDSRYWHKARFPKESSPYPDLSATCKSLDEAGKGFDMLTSGGSAEYNSDTGVKFNIGK